MGGIFISYRREDSGPYAGRLRDALSHHFGAEQVFRDIDRINPGERFPRVIEQEVGSCQALLAVIGSTWLSIKDDAGQRRLDDPEDYVRLEIVAALARGTTCWSSPYWSAPRRCPPTPTCRRLWHHSQSATRCASATKTGTTRWHALQSTREGGTATRRALTTPGRRASS